MRRTILAAAALAIPAGCLPAQPAALRNARVTVHAAATGGLSGQIAALAFAAGPIWVAWEAPAQDRHSVLCCGRAAEAGPNDASDRARCGTCRLERDEPFSIRTQETEVPMPAGPADFLIFARLERGRAEKLRSFSLDCAIDAGGMPVAWIDGVRPEESISWLETLVPKRPPRPEGEDPDEEGAEQGTADAAVAAIALHGVPAADEALESMIAPGRPARVRRRAAFWLAAARGAQGCRRLEARVPPDEDAGFRKQGTFALSLCRTPEALHALFSMARRDPAPRVRGQALFWLARKAGRKAASAVEDAIQEDPDTEVKKLAVFALTQMPDGEGVPELIRVARTNRNPAVRERAMFWLGQTQDPRALDFIEGILTK